MGKRLASAIPLGVEKSFSKTIKREQFSFGRGVIYYPKFQRKVIFQEHFVIEFQFNFALNNFLDKTKPSQS